MEYSSYGGLIGIKAWSWAIAEVFAADGSGHIGTYCEHHLPEGIDADSEQVSPIFASDELDYYPACDVCGEQYTYMGLTEDGEQNNPDDARQGDCNAGGM
jgi:hypothetical protein